MVGFVPETSTDKDSSPVSKLKIFKDPIDLLDPKPEDLSIADSFLDFDSIKEWFEDNQNLDRVGSQESEVGAIEKSMEICKEDNLEKTHVADPRVSESEPDVHGFKPIVCGPGLVGGESGCTVKVEEEESEPERMSSYSEKEIGKVSLVGGLESGSSSSEESETESTSSSLSPCGSSDDDDDDVEEEEEEETENKQKVKVEIKREVDAACELEEGEIAGIDGEMDVRGTDYLDDDEEEGAEETEETLSGFGTEADEFGDEDDGAGAMRGPIRSKNEFEVLPLVPPLVVALQPHHQMLPVGVVLSIIGTKVIVEGREQHNPLNEGSVLWITIDRSPLGLVDEIFGPVKNPYYVVRYNSESEVPAGIYEGSSISFVPEFANHVLNDKKLHKKGYDASGENDEELSDDVEFSDDEKEAEYKRMQKMRQRALNQRVGNRKSNKKKVKSRNWAWRNDRSSAQQTSTVVGQQTSNQNQHNFSTVAASLGNLNCSSSVVEQNIVGGSGFIRPFSVMPQYSGFISSSYGVWANGVPTQKPQNANKFSADGMQLLSQNYEQQPIPLPTRMPYQLQQFDPSLSTLPNAVIPGGQSNLYAGPASAPWLGIADQNGFSQNTFGVGIEGQQFRGALQGILANEPAADGNCNLQVIQGNFKTSEHFNLGASGRGKKPYRRARDRGRFTGGTGHQQS
ncbi:hypothetical protein DITRI_Ditri08aG0064100 [Diplodiscus trichospermus]